MHKKKRAGIKKDKKQETGWESSGNMRPASTSTMSSPHSKTVMFLPMPSRPPSGMIFKGDDFLAAIG